MNEYELKRIVEAVLFVSDKPMTVKEIWRKLFGPNVEAKSSSTDKKSGKKTAKQSKAAQPLDEVSSEDQNPVVGEAPEDNQVDSENKADTDAQSDHNDIDTDDMSTELFMDYGVSKDDVYQALCALQSDYAGRGCELKEVASGYRFQVNEDLAIWLQRWKAEKPPRYSRAVLETLAIIAYKQPITRAEIEDIRGVAVSSHIVKGLLEREWVRIVGHKEVPGRPALFATTKTFLDYFNVTSLEELPTLAEIKELGVRQSTDEELPSGAGEVNKTEQAQDQSAQAVPIQSAEDQPEEQPTESAEAVVADPDVTCVPEDVPTVESAVDSVTEEHASVETDSLVDDGGEGVGFADGAGESLANILSESTLMTKSADKSIKNTVECKDSDTLLEKESTDSVNMAMQDAPILASSIQDGSVFEQSDDAVKQNHETLDG